MEKIIEAKNLTKVYGEDGTSVTALNNVNLDFYENKFTAIMGQSGSGKSTFLLKSFACSIILFIPLFTKLPINC